MADAETSSPERLPALLVIGDFFSAVMEPVRRCVENLVEGGCEARLEARVPATVASRAGVPATVASPAGEPATVTSPAGEAWFPDLVVVCQHWPDEFAAADVRRLLALYPLARVSCCYGPWCASDGRSRDIWPFAVRVPVRCAAGRILRELEAFAGRRRPLPLTASRDEVLLFDASVL